MDVINQHIDVRPLVSICIPAYNVEKYIQTTINSVINQTYTNLEIIIVDDGSTDSTVSMISSITDKRIKVIQQKNKGAANSRNTAFKNAQGSLIKFMDADDLLSSDFINEQVKAISNSNNIATSLWGRFKKDDLSDFALSPEKKYDTISGIDWLIESLLYTGANMTPPSLYLIPRQLIEKNGLWDESLSLIDDFEFITKMLLACDNLIFCNNAILYYRSGVINSLSSQKSRMHYESAYHSLTKGTQYILSKNNSSKSKLACANVLQHWVYIFYPKNKDLGEKLILKIKKLGGSDLKYNGGRLFNLIRLIFGWKITKQFQIYFLKLKCMFNSKI